jgi:hypothetical protein
MHSGRKKVILDADFGCGKTLLLKSFALYLAASLKEKKEKGAATQVFFVSLSAAPSQVKVHLRPATQHWPKNEADFRKYRGASPLEGKFTGDSRKLGIISSDYWEISPPGDFLPNTLGNLLCFRDSILYLPTSRQQRYFKT